MTKDKFKSELLNMLSNELSGDALNTVENLKNDAGAARFDTDAKAAQPDTDAGAAQLSAKDAEAAGTNAGESTGNPDPQISAIILTAGYSSRMSDFKPLLPIGGVSAIERIIYSLKIAGIDDIVAVTGYNSDKLSPILAKNHVFEAYNPDFDKGMFSSIQTGVCEIAAVADSDAGDSSCTDDDSCLSDYREPDGVFLIPVDTPLIQIRIFRELLAKVKALQANPETADRMLVPTYLGKKGHPLFIPSCYYREILDIPADNNRGLKAITEKYDHLLMRQPVDSESIILDMDDPQGYDELLEYYEHDCEDEKLSELAMGHRFVLVRHGQIQQHDDKIFLGQTDVPLSEQGRAEAKDAAAKLASMARNGDFSVDRIYSSDLLRAEDTAEYIAEMLDEANREMTEKQMINVIGVKAFREMSLGEWDGRYIHEIKAEYPEEYKRRGENLFSFKFGHKCENFFDLQYRVLKELKKILKWENEQNCSKSDSRSEQNCSESDSRSEYDSCSKADIMIVAHSGVLRVIENALKGLDVSDDWDKIPTGRFRVVEVQK